MTQGTNKPASKLDTLVQRLAAADKTYRKLPINMRLEIEKISQGLAEFGPRKLRRRGPGTEFYEARDFRDGDDPRRINARLTARLDRPTVVEKEAEIRQYFYLWRKGNEMMDFRSNEKIPSKKEAAEIMLLAFAKHLARNEDMVGILEGKGMYRGGKVAEQVGQQLMAVNVITGDLPMVGRSLPKNSTAVLFSDFLDKPEDIKASLGKMTGSGLQGFLVVVLDPQELDFNYSGHMEFKAVKGDLKLRFPKAQTMRDAYREKIRAHIAEVESIAQAKGFKLILQRTDKPLHEGLLALYGLKPSAPVPKL